MRKNSSEFVTGFITEAGTFKTNKDYFAYMELDDLACWIAADGIDSDEEMESAEMAVKSIFSDFSEKPSMSGGRLKKYVKNAHKLLKSESRSVRLKCSLVIVVTDYSRYIWAVAGNSRVYHFRKGRLFTKSKDQSVAQMVADSGKITHDEISEHEERNNLTNYLGKQNGFKPFISKKIKLVDGDWLILSTSGCWENIDSVEIIDAISDTNDPNEAVDMLEELLLGKQKKVLNNYTIAAVLAGKVFKEKAKTSMKPVIKKVAAVVLSLAILVAGVFVYKKIQNTMNEGKIAAGILKSEKNGDGFVKDGIYEKALKMYEDAQNKMENIRIKDEEMEERIKTKSRITQLIIDGESCFKSKDYYGAKTNYQKAGQEIEKEGDYDKVKLEEKMTENQKYINIIQLVQEADKMAIYDKKGALEKYKEAKNKAELIFFDAKAQELDTKIEKMEGTLNSEETEKKKFEAAQKYEQEGNKAYSTKNYAGAISNFNIARDLYQELNKTEYLSGVNVKINTAQRAIEEEARKAKEAEEAAKAAKNN